jgi:hypothetical protein
MVTEIWPKTYELGQVCGYSRRLAEIRVAEVLVNALCEQVAVSSLSSACAALKSIVVTFQLNWKNNSFSGGYPLRQVLDSDLN